MKKKEGNKEKKKEMNKGKILSLIDGWIEGRLTARKKGRME